LEESACISKDRKRRENEFAKKGSILDILLFPAAKKIWSKTEPSSP
jgi:hypothetical protein